MALQCTEYLHLCGDTKNILSYIRMYFKLMDQVNIFFLKSQASTSILPLLKNQCGTRLHVSELKPLISAVCHLQIEVVLQPEIA